MPPRHQGTKGHQVFFSSRVLAFLAANFFSCKTLQFLHSLKNNNLYLMHLSGNCTLKNSATLHTLTAMVMFCHQGTKAPRLTKFFFYLLTFSNTVFSSRFFAFFAANFCVFFVFLCAFVPWWPVFERFKRYDRFVDL